MMTLFFLWTVLILFGSLAPGDNLPPIGWMATIPHFDKIIHFGFYLGQVTLILLWLQPRKGKRIWIALGAIFFSGIIEIMQSLFFNRNAEWYDLMANALGAFSGIILAALTLRILPEKYISR